jgi:hypothetical protein
LAENCANGSTAIWTAHFPRSSGADAARPFCPHCAMSGSGGPLARKRAEERRARQLALRSAAGGRNDASKTSPAFGIAALKV